MMMDHCSLLPFLAIQSGKKVSEMTEKSQECVDLKAGAPMVLVQLFLDASP
jgi:hypothetical protein